MTRDDIIRLAREAGLMGPYSEKWPYIEDEEVTEFAERFAALVAAPLEEEIKRLRFCTTEGDAAAAMEYLAHCVEKEIAKEQERCMEIVERELEAALGYVAVPLGNKITAAIRARGK